MTVRELDARMSLSEFFEWQQYDEARAERAEREQEERAEEEASKERLARRRAELGM